MLASPFFLLTTVVTVFFFLSSCRNPAYFSTPNTRTDMYPPLSNLSITSARQDDHSNFQLPGFSAGSSVTPLRPSDAYIPYSAGVSVTKTSPSKVSLTPYELEQGLFLNGWQCNFLRRFSFALSRIPPIVLYCCVTKQLEYLRSY